MFSSMLDTSDKMRSYDRIFILRPIDGTKPLSSLGMTDSRLFTGENKLHAVMDTSNRMWSLKYEIGGVPNPLKQQFTSFKTALECAEGYFKQRNVEIKEIID